jgi:hypothetical protein
MTTPTGTMQNDDRHKFKLPSWELTTPESLPLLKVISKLGPIVVVKSSPLGQTLGLPHFCFMPSDYNHAALNLKGLGEAMAGFESKGEWFITSDFPRICVLVQPKERKYAGSHDAGVQFRELITKEIPKMSVWLEERLNLNSAPDRGLELQPVDLSLEGSGDYYAPHLNNIYLVADPKAFAGNTTQMTSPQDRLLHYGLSLRDMDILRNAAGARDKQQNDWKFLSRFWQEYKDQFIVRSEVLDLQAELRRLRAESNDPEVDHACDILLSISSSAARHNLGIFIESE